MIKNLIFSIFLLLSNISAAGWAWTDNNNWKGTGVEVKNVYIQRTQHWVTFSDQNGKQYYYYWGVENNPTEAAKIYFSMLLTAFSANKKVSIYVNSEPEESGAWYEYTTINLHE